MLLELRQKPRGDGTWRSASSVGRAEIEIAELIPVHAALSALMRDLGGQSALLTLHPDGDARPRVLASFGEALPGDGLDTMMATAVLASGTDEHDPGLRDAQRFDSRGAGEDVLVLPFVSKAGRSRVLMSVAFAAGTLPGRSALKLALSDTWPLIDAFLRCWQRERQLRRQAMATEAALNRMDFGVILVTRSGQAWFVNDAGARILEAGHVVRRRGGVLVATKLAENMMLQSSLASAIAASDMAAGEGGAADGGTLLKLGTHEHALICATAPLGTLAEEAGDTAAMVILIDPAHNPDRLVQPLCKLYGLSPVETRLACQLVRGASLGEASQALRIKEQTARSYLKQIFAKLNVRRQADLVRMLLTSAVRSRSIVATDPVLRFAPK